MTAPNSKVYFGGDPVEILRLMPQRLGDLVRKWAKESPASPALVVAGKTVGYEQLASAVDRAKQKLADAGVRPGDRIMIVNENSIAGVVFILAATECDAWACPINARMSWQEVEACRKFADCRLAVYTTGDSAAAAAHAVTAMAIVQVDEVAGKYAIGQFCETATTEPTSSDRAEQAAVLLFSSGTTGTPKGIVLSHQAIMYMGGNMAMLRDLTQNDVFYNITPISHVIGLGAMLTAAFWAGASTELVTQFKPESFVDALQAERISYIMGVPTIFTRLLEYSRFTGRSLRSSRMRHIAVGGMPLDLTLKAETEAAFGLGLSNSYGMSEISPVTRSRFAGKGASVGEPQPGISVRIVRGDGSDANVGEAGEIWAKGPSLMLGYFRDEALNQSIRRSDGFITTGDIGVMDETGCLTLVGRIKDVIIRSGFNVYPVEVESVLSQFSGVAMTAVVGRLNAGNEEIVAYVQPLAGRTLDISAIERFAREQLTPYKRPSEIIITSDLPIGPTGKVLKSRLKEQIAISSALRGQ